MEIEEDEAFATARFVDADTGETIGYVYIWEDGIEQPLWLSPRRENALRVKHSVNGKPIQDKAGSIR